MKKLICLYLFLIAKTFIWAQVSTTQDAMSQSFLIYRMAEKFHVQPKPFDSLFSTQCFSLLMQKLDENKLIFLQPDYEKWKPIQHSICNQIKTQKDELLKQILPSYKQNLQRVDSMLTVIEKANLLAVKNEEYKLLEDSVRPLSILTQYKKLNKFIRKQIDTKVAAYIADEDVDAKAWNKTIDSLTPVYQKKVIGKFKRLIKTILFQPGGVEAYLAEQFCEAVSNTYDPHSDFMTITRKENFESEVGKKPMEFGFVFQEEEGDLVITDLIPGSPAFNSGQLNVGDKLMAIKWDGQQEIDISDATESEAVKILDKSNYAKAVITVLKADGSKRSVQLQKQQANAELEDIKVKSYVLKGKYNIGYINLPSFYQDWDEEKNVNGCSNDVAKEIIKLKKENISGLVIDVRYNGGGSLAEAVDLAGLFIDAGPVFQQKLREVKPHVYKDLNRGTLYDGPLMVMINGYSASASELFAGCLQDYNRALIVGSNSFGKSTSQTILPLDTTYDEANHNSDNLKKATSFIKLTRSQLYRLNGKSAQLNGIDPDITLPDITEVADEKEKTEPYALLCSPIQPNKYYLPLNALPVDVLQRKAQSYVQADSFFIALQKFIQQIRVQKASNKYLSLFERIKQYKIYNQYFEHVFTDSSKTNPYYNIKLNNYDIEREALTASAKHDDDDLPTYLSLNNDPYLIVVYRLFADMILPK